MIVDSHAHIFAAVSDRYPRDVHELYPADLEASAELLLETMEVAGVDRAVLVPLSHHDEYLRECLHRYEDRFAGIGLQADETFDVDAYRRRREDVGLSGVRLFDLGNAAVAEPRELPCFPLLAEFAAAGDKLWFYGGEAQMELLVRVLETLPDLTVVLNHLGFWPGGLFIDEHGRPHFTSSYTADNLATVQGLARFPRVYVLLSGYYAFSSEPWPYADLRSVTEGLLGAFGAERLLLASDFPWIRIEPGYPSTVDTLDAQISGLAAADRARIRGANAVDLFGFR